jgi:inner membrane protein
MGMDYVTLLTYWHWLIFGLFLVGLEILVPGSFFIWIGLSALVVGGLSWLLPIPTALVFLLFGVLSIVFTFLGKRYFSVSSSVKKHSSLNRRGDQYIGQHLVLSQAIVNNKGRAHIGDTVWPVRGPDLPVNAVVEVIGVEGNTLIVKKINSPTG